MARKELWREKRKERDERPLAVITTPFTFAASTNVILHAGLVPLFADISADDFNLAPAAVEETYERCRKEFDIRGVLPIDYAGRPCALRELRELCAKHDLFLLEDAAHAIGAKYGGDRVGSGKIAAGTDLAVVFSFHAVKNLTTAEGGMLVCEDGDLAERVRRWSYHGQTRTARERYHAAPGEKPKWEYDIEVPGYSYNMTDIAAGIGLAQLDKLEKGREWRERVFDAYDDAFGKEPSLEVPARGEHDALHLYPLRLNTERFRFPGVSAADKATVRNRFIDALNAENISCNVHFKPIYRFGYFFRHVYPEGGPPAVLRERARLHPEPWKHFPICERQFERVVTLPVYPAMARDEDGLPARQVVQAVTRICRHFAS
jgi:dTDP-4-amino-4,6-dideoxygalactose transaminase